MRWVINSHSNEFTDFIESAGFLGWESTEWFLSDFTISTDNNSAHASYFNVRFHLSKSICTTSFIKGEQAMARECLYSS